MSKSAAGRPARDKRKYFEGKLYPLLAAQLPHHVDASGSLNVNSLAAALGVSGQTLYFSMSEDRLTPRIAKLILNESRGKLTAENLAPFVIV